MKELNYKQIRPGPARFDNAPIGFIVQWMNPSRLKAVRGFAAIAGSVLMLVGCETTEADAVPKRTATTELAPPVVTSVAPAQYTTPTPQNRPVQIAQASDQAPPPSANNGSGDSTNSAPPLEVKEVVPPAIPANLHLSEGVQQVVKLAQAHSDETVLTAFVQRYPTRFELDADEILYLGDLGVPSTVVAAMLKHDGDDPARAAAVTNAPNTETAQPVLPGATAPQQVISQQPGAVEVTTNYVPNAGYVQQPQVIVQQPQTVVVQQQPQVVYAQPETVTPFYDSLSPYGSWMYVSDYGWCWQPTVAVVDVGWRPYGHHGRWLWTNDGWYWSSYYSWGWAPFHYGRWTLAPRHGWVWMPDTTWGPAWVTWRSSGDYCGWAPLPPAARFVPGAGFYYHGRSVDVGFGFGLGYDAFCFTPVRHFYEPHLHGYFLPRHEVRSVFPHSHVENRFEVHRDRFVNNGIPHDRVASASHQEIRPAVVREMPHQEVARFGARERVEHTGRQEVVYRPNLMAAAEVAKSPARVAPVTMPSGVSTVAPIRNRSEPSGRSGIVANPTPSPAPTRNFEPATRGQVTGRYNSGAPVVSTPSTPAPNVTAPRSAGEGRIVNPAGRLEANRREPSRVPVVTQPTTPAPRVEAPAPRVEPTPAPRVEVNRSTPPSAAPPVVTRPAPAPAPAPAYQPPQHVTRQSPVIMPQPGGMVRPPPVSQPSVAPSTPRGGQPQPPQDRRGGGNPGRTDRRGRD